MLEDIKPRLGELKEKLDQMELSLEVPAKEENKAPVEGGDTVLISANLRKL